MKAKVANEMESKTQLKGWKRGSNEYQGKIYPAVVDRDDPHCQKKPGHMSLI